VSGTHPSRGPRYTLTPPSSPKSRQCPYRTVITRAGDDQMSFHLDILEKGAWSKKFEDTCRR
jgi:hypothetical protein